MTSFRYVALARDGKKVRGIQEGFNEMDATSRIKEKYDVILKLKKVGFQGGGILSMEIGGKRLNTKAFVLMCSQFATILKAGIPIARAVKLIADKTTDKKIREILFRVAEDVEAGRSLSSSFDDEGGGMFPQTFVETLRAGEESGKLPEAFASVYRHFDKQTKMSGKVRSAMTYPLFVLLVAAVVLVVLMVAVVPSFIQIFDSFGGELPLMTRMLIGFSNFMKVALPFIAIGGVALTLFLKLYGATDNGRIRLAKIQLRIPVLGNIAELNAASQFANTMATMVESGIPLTKAVSITGRVMENFWIRQSVESMAGRIEEGHTVSDSMREAKCLPDILTDMVGVGEETGEMKETLETVAEYYDSELELAVQNALAMLEPSLLVFIAIVAGFIVISVYMSMFSMYSYM